MSDLQAISGAPGEAVEPESPQLLALMDEFHRQFQQAGYVHCLLLTGPARLDTFPAEKLEALRAAGVAVTQVRIRHPQLDPSHWPWLLQLDLNRFQHAEVALAATRMAWEDWAPEALASRRGHRIAAFLYSDAGIEEISLHLAGLALQPRPDGGTRLLSLFDPAAFEGIWRVCKEEQRARLLGPIGQWRILDRWRNWTACHVAAPHQGAQHSSLALLAEQWISLSHVGAINRAWVRAREAGAVPQPDRFNRLPDALLRAHGYGLRDPQDLELFAWHALSVRPDFDLHPRLRLLLQTRQPDVSYGLASAGLGQAEWAEIQSERSASQTAYHARG